MAMTDSKDSSRLARPPRLEALTLRCEREARRRIEEAFARERKDRPQLSLGRFLAECVANGLPGNLMPSLHSGEKPDANANRIAEMVTMALAERLAAVETAVPVIADVLGELAGQLARIEQSVRDAQTDAAHVRRIMDEATARRSGEAGVSAA
jgi:hypothetical protein